MPTSFPEHIIAFFSNIPSSSVSYRKVIEGSGKPYLKNFTMDDGSPLVVGDFDSPDIHEGSIAYHPVFGYVSYRSRWGFSTQSFIVNLKAADENPAITAHLIHVDSCGGEAFGCHEAFTAVKGLKKPCYSLIDTVAASAGYYLVAGADKIFASSMFSEIGCIGIMSTMYDDTEWMKKAGLEEHEYYSNYSPLKNKVFNDARKGDGSEFVKRFLDPMAYRFIEDVKSARKDISQAACEGETFYAAEALPAGLIDGENTLDEVIAIIMSTVKPADTVPEININQLNFSL